jgi:hypothetical protein
VKQGALSGSGPMVGIMPIGIMPMVGPKRVFMFALRKPKSPPLRSQSAHSSDEAE